MVFVFKGTPTRTPFIKGVVSCVGNFLNVNAFRLCVYIYKHPWVVSLPGPQFIDVARDKRMLTVN